MSFQDDASRLVGFGVFDEPAGDHAIKVLEKAIKRGKPAQIFVDHGSQFYANVKENSKHSIAMFEAKLVELGLRQAMTSARHPQANGKLEESHLEMQKRLKSFED